MDNTPKKENEVMYLNIDDLFSGKSNVDVVDENGNKIDLSNKNKKEEK